MEESSCRVKLVCSPEDTTIAASERRTSQDLAAAEASPGPAPDTATAARACVPLYRGRPSPQRGRARAMGGDPHGRQRQPGAPTAPGSNNASVPEEHDARWCTLCRASIPTEELCICWPFARQLHAKGRASTLPPRAHVIHRRPAINFEQVNDEHHWRVGGGDTPARGPGARRHQGGSVQVYASRGGPWRWGGLPSRSPGASPAGIGGQLAAKA